VLGKTLESITSDMGTFWHQLTQDSQARWLGRRRASSTSPRPPSSTRSNLWARAEGSLSEAHRRSPPERIVSLIDFHYITDAITPDEALLLPVARRRAASASLK
jgi:L-fuconate dehydratase